MFKDRKKDGNRPVLATTHMPINNRMGKWWYIYTMQYHSAMKINNMDKSQT